MTKYWVNYGHYSRWAIIVRVSGEVKGPELIVDKAELIFNDTGSEYNANDLKGRLGLGVLSSEQQVIELIFEEIYK